MKRPSMTRPAKPALECALGGEPSETPQALRRLERGHANLTGLADLLESIADDLPRPDRFSCLRAEALLLGELPLHYADKDLGLFPVLRLRCAAEDRIEAVLAQLEAEHLDDEAALDEVVPMLSALALGGELRMDIDGVGYALRGFFEAQRRHLAWENATVMPMARARLSEDDWHAVGRVMLANRMGPTPDAMARRQCRTPDGYAGCLREAAARGGTAAHAGGASTGGPEASKAGPEVVKSTVVVGRRGEGV